MNRIRTASSSTVTPSAVLSFCPGARAVLFGLIMVISFRDSLCRAQAADTNAATVQLSPAQLNEIKIEPIATYLFPLEKEAVGSICFDEDPAIVQAQSTLVGAAATYDLNRKELDRVNALGETNGIAPKELEQATSDAQTSEAALKAARDAVRALGITDADIDQMIASGKIRSAFGTNNPTGSVLANVIETDSPLLRVGQPVKVNVIAFTNQVFEGRISKIYATVDPNTHRVAVRSEVDDPKNELRIGMLADVVVRVQNPVTATAIPVNGVVREPDGTMTVWTTTDRSHFFQRVVKLGRQADGRYQIVEGLQPGELAVTDGAVFLSNILNAPPGDD